MPCPTVTASKTRLWSPRRHSSTPSALMRPTPDRRDGCPGDIARCSCRTRSKGRGARQARLQNNRPGVQIPPGAPTTKTPPIVAGSLSLVHTLGVRERPWGVGPRPAVRRGAQQRGGGWVGTNPSGRTNREWRHLLVAPFSISGFGWHFESLGSPPRRFRRIAPTAGLFRCCTARSGGRAGGASNPSGRTSV
jgi:hypothetical protein